MLGRLERGGMERTWGEERDEWEEASQRVCWLMLILTDLFEMISEFISKWELQHSQEIKLSHRSLNTVFSHKIR